MLRKRSTEFLPPAHICGFISRKKMKNKHAAGILGNHGGLTTPTRKKKRFGVWRLCWWDAGALQKVRS